MVHDRPQLAIVRIIVAAVIISNLAIILTAHAAGDETLLLEVIINGNSTGKIGQFV